MLDLSPGGANTRSFSVASPHRDPAGEAEIVEPSYWPLLINGAASIMGLDLPAGLARSIEDVLTASLEGGAATGPATIKTLLGAVEIFERLSETETPYIMSRIEECKAEIAELSAALRGHLASPSGRKTADPTEPEMAAIDPLSAASGPQQALDLLDAPMLDLFRMEVASHAASLESGLIELEAARGGKRYDRTLSGRRFIKGPRG